MPVANDAVWIDVLPSMKKFGPALDKGVDSAGASAGKKAGGSFTAGFKNSLKVGAVLGAALATRAAIGGIKEATREASNLGESINAVNVTFGKQAEGIKRLSKEAADGLGLSQSEFNGLAVQFSAFTKTIAGRGGDVTKTMDELTTRGADFASVMNLEVNEAMGLFQSGLAGETEPLRKFGIDLSAAAVESHAYAAGIAETGKKLTENQKVQARYSLLMKQTSKTQGDFTNTSDSLANSQRRLGAQMDDLQAQVGAKLIPIFEDLSAWALNTGLPALRRFGDWFQREGMPKVKAFGNFLKSPVLPILKDIGQWIGKNADWLGMLAAGLGAAYAAFKTFMFIKNVITAVKAFNLVLMANPIGLVIAALAALVAGLVIAYKKSDTFRAIVDGVWKFIKKAFGGIKDIVLMAVLWIVDKWLWFAEKLVDGADKAFGWIPGLDGKLDKAKAAVARFREGVNAEMDKIRDEDVNIRVLTSRAASGDVSGMFRGKYGDMGGYGGAGGLTPRVSAPLAPVRRVATDIGSDVKSTAEAIERELSRRYAASLGKSGRVLPKGSYRVGMPYLGYPGHYGADYPAPTGTPVHALRTGVVSRALSLTTSYGRHVYLDHPGGIQTRYAHLNGYTVAPGQVVQAGQVIGYVGSTGNSTGPHLHFEYRRGGAPVNPASLGIFDNGGWLKPGMGGVNLTDKPEPVFTHEQWRTLKGAMGGKGGPLDKARKAFDLDGGMTRAEVRAEIKAFAKAWKDAGKTWNKAQERMAKAAETVARKYRQQAQALEKANAAVQALKDKSKEFAASVAGTFNNDIFGNGAAGLGLQLRADANDANAMKAALATAARKGLDGALFQALAASGDLTTAQQLAGMNKKQIADYERLYAARAAAQQGLGQYAANTAYGGQIKAAQATADRTERTLKRLDARLGGLEAAVERGARRGVGDQNRRTSDRKKAGR